MNNRYSRRDFMINSTLAAGSGLLAAGIPGEATGSGLNTEQKTPVNMPSLKALKLFDSCVTLGQFTSEISIGSAEKLLAIMDRYEIAEALVHEYHARSVYPLENANNRLMNLISGEPRLHPVWVLEPAMQGGSSNKIVEHMLESGVRAARLKLNMKGVIPFVWDGLLSALEAHRVPCFLDFGSPETTLGGLEDSDIQALSVMVSNHPDLPFILSHIMGGRGVNPAAIVLIRQAKNLYMDITGILEYWRNVAYSLGPERVLFATGMPFTDPGILVSNVQYALDLDEKAKKMICGDNLRRLMGGVR